MYVQKVASRWCPLCWGFISSRSALWGFWGLGPFGVKGPVGLTCYNRYASPGHGPSHLRRILLARRTARFQMMMGERRVLAETRTTTRIMVLGSLILVLRIATLSPNCDNRDTAESTYTDPPTMVYKHPGELAPDLETWKREMEAEITRCNKGISQGGKTYLPCLVLSPRPPMHIRPGQCWYGPPMFDRIWHTTWRLKRFQTLSGMCAGFTIRACPDWMIGFAGEGGVAPPVIGVEVCGLAPAAEPAPDLVDLAGV